MPTAIFTCKPESIRNLDKTGNRDEYIVVRTVALMRQAFDEFCAAPLAAHADWFSDLPDLPGVRGGSIRCVVKLTSPGRNALLVDPSGYDYARYIARA